MIHLRRRAGAALQAVLLVLALRARLGVGICLGLGAGLLATGCGVPLQDDAALLRARPAPTATAPDLGGMRTARVYLISDGRLEPAERSTDDTSAQSAVELLVEGPTASEEAAGVTTAVPPGDFTAEESSLGRTPGGSMVVNVPAQFTQIDGDLQLLATAQLVWTVTERRPRGLVRMTFEGEPIELPTDRGLTSGPVRRSDFTSVAPGAAPLLSFLLE